MKIVGKMILNYNDSFVPYLEAKVKFKVPNKNFKYTYKQNLVNAWDEKYSSKNPSRDFKSDCLDILKDKERLLNIGKEMIMKRMANEKDNIVSENNNKEISKLIKDFNKDIIDIVVEIE
jgi:disulfide oxidoreductase YuzD